MKIYFYGSSDDLIEIKSDNGKLDNEIGSYDCPCSVKVQTPDGDGLAVFAHYAPDGCPDGTWVFGVTLLGEDHPLPTWPVSFQTAENGYSPCLVIDSPDDVRLSWGDNGHDK